MHSKLIATAGAALSIVALASPSFAQHHHLSREAAMHKCNALVKEHRSASMAADTQRAAAWKACMTQLGHRP